MQQGHSGSFVRRNGQLVEKASTDATFMDSPERQRDLMRLSARLKCLPRIFRVERGVISMDFVEGVEGMTASNAVRAGKALRELHDADEYPHECMTGMWWLIDLANENLRNSGAGLSIDPSIETLFPHDAVIHSEPVQYVECDDGRIVLIDIEGLGTGSRYRDLGYVHYSALLRETPALVASFLQGYGALSGDDAHKKIAMAAGITALAYSGFADRDIRQALGFRILANTPEVFLE